MTDQGRLVAVLVLAGVVLAVLGFRIRFYREWHLIAGFDLHNVRDPEGLGRWVGGVGIVLGAISLGAAALALTRPDLNAALGSAYSTAVCTATVVLAVGSMRYLV